MFSLITGELVNREPRASGKPRQGSKKYQTMDTGPLAPQISDHAERLPLVSKHPFGNEDDGAGVRTKQVLSFPGMLVVVAGLAQSRVDIHT